MTQIDFWYLENLVCPISGSDLALEGNFLVNEEGRRYPVVDGMPVMLVDDAPQTIGVARTTLDLALAIAKGQTSGDPPLFVETLGISEEERAAAKALGAVDGSYDPVVSVMIGATSGYAYKHMVGVSAPYPIPALRFPTPKPGRLLDVGCNWGRWTIAAAREGHDAVGIDPQLGAVLAARRVAEQMGVPAHFVVADARFLPFRPSAFDYAWSYSVLQHFSREDALTSFRQMRRIVRTGGLVRAQMANSLGLRSLYHMSRRGFREPTGFEVRYWSPIELTTELTKVVGKTGLDVDCYLGLGLQWSDFDRMDWLGKGILSVSEALRRASTVVGPLRWVADSLFCTSRVEACD
jgi:SAM-dependent methyltransferase